MKAMVTETTNTVFQGEGLNDLPVTQFKSADDVLVTECCFELNEEELKKVAETGKIYITFLGQRVIPFMPHVESNVGVKKKRKRKSDGGGE